MRVLKETNDTRLVALPLVAGPSGITKYQIHKRLGAGTAFETVSEVIVSDATNCPNKDELTISDLKLIVDDAIARHS